MVFKTNIIWKEEVETLREFARQGYTYQQVGDHYGVTRERIRQVLWKHVKDWEDIHLKTKKALERTEEYQLKFGAKKETAPDLYSAQRAKFRAKKYNATRTGWEWTIQFGELNWPSHCPILGIELDYFAEGRQENSPSFDQIDAGKGYVKGNVHIISWRANRIKNDGTSKEHRQIADYLDSLSS